MRAEHAHRYSAPRWRLSRMCTVESRTYACACVACFSLIHRPRPGLAGRRIPHFRASTTNQERINGSPQATCSRQSRKTRSSSSTSASPTPAARSSTSRCRRSTSTRTSSRTAMPSTARRSPAGRASRPPTCCSCRIRIPRAWIRSTTSRRSNISLRRARAARRQGLRPRPALDREEGRGLPQVAPASATPPTSAPSPSSSSSTASTWNVDMSGCFVKIKSEEAPWSTGIDYEGGNLGHRAPVKGGYFPVPPVDSLQDIRNGDVPRARGAGRRSRSAPPRGGGARPVRDRHQVQHRW